MRVLLVKPSNLSDHIQPSLGLGYLAAHIRDKHEVKIVDCLKERMPAARLATILQECQPDIVGCQCYSMDLPKVKPILQVVKQHNPKIVTILGGAHPTAAPQQTLNFFGTALVDYLFVGEGEIGFPMFVNAIANDGKQGFPDVPGLGWIDHSGSLRLNPPQQAQGLGSLGMPAWDLIMPETYPFSPHGVVCKNFPVAPVMSTRGCPYLCAFCSSANTELRKRPVPLVLEEVKMLYHEHGIREFHMVDDNFTLDMKYAREFLEALIKDGPKASWATPNGVRLDRLDKPLLELMREAGFYSISVGIESGSDRILTKMKKGNSTAKIRRNLAMVHEVKGIDVTGFFMLGFPGETREDIELTLRFSRELPIQRATFHSYIPLPGTESWRELERTGELDRVDWEKYFFWAGAYVPTGLMRKELRAFHRKAFLLFYLRPRIIAENLRWVVRPRLLWYALKYLWKRLLP